MTIDVRASYGRLDRDKPRGTQDVYTYLCADGVTRTRCKAHAAAAKGTKVGASPYLRKGDILAHKGTCVECSWNRAIDVVTVEKPREAME